MMRRKRRRNEAEPHKSGYTGTIGAAKRGDSENKPPERKNAVK